MQSRIRRSPVGGQSNAFAERVKAARLQAGLSQQQLFDRLKEQTGVSLDTSAITRIEAGQRDPRLSEALAIAKVLHFQLDDLVSRTDLDSHMGDVERSIEETNDTLLKLLSSVDTVVEFVRLNPSCLGDEPLEERLGGVIEGIHKRMSPGDFAITTSRADERLKRQLLRAVTDAILVRADEVTPTYERWFKDDVGEAQRIGRKTSTPARNVRGPQRVASHTKAEK